MAAAASEARKSARSATSRGSMRRLDGGGGEHHVPDHVVGGYAEGPGLVRDLGFDESGADVGWAYGVGGYSEWPGLQRGCFGQADEAVLGGGMADL